jgi:hypothetical protein
MNEVQAIIEVLDVLRRIEPRIGEYERHTVDPSTFGFAVKLSNGHIRIPPEAIQDIGVSQLFESTIQKMLSSFRLD